jgi:imidazolonepropionase
MAESIAIANIGSLVTNDPTLGNGPLGIISDAALVMLANRIVWVGPMDDLQPTDQSVDACGRAVIPGFVDSHAHPVFAGDRATEFAARMSGQPYRAGGIRSTVRLTRLASDDELYGTIERLEGEFNRAGITTFEAKSGYGLTVHDEARALRLAARLTEETTFLGAHVVPEEFAGDPDGYVRLVCEDMTAAVTPYAKWVDVFCDRGAFDVDQSRAVLQAGIRSGLQPRIHANQLERGGGVELAVEMDAASADHCTHLSDSDVELLAGSRTVATLLPGAEFSTRSPYPDARRLIDAGATVALATDCNPGSSYTTSMSFCIAVAVREMGMTPDEALWSATLGGARALRRKTLGHLVVGAQADVVELDAPSHIHLAYRPGVDLIRRVWSEGSLVHAREREKG